MNQITVWKKTKPNTFMYIEMYTPEADTTKKKTVNKQEKV